MCWDPGGHSLAAARAITAGLQRASRPSDARGCRARSRALERRCGPTARPGPESGPVLRLVPVGTLLYGEKGTKRVLEYARLAMGFANVRASRYGIR